MSLIRNGEERVLYAASRALLRTAPNAFESTAVVLLEDHKAVVEKLQQQIWKLEAENRAMRPVFVRDSWARNPDRSGQS